jgi:hypothetical protein
VGRRHLSRGAALGAALALAAPASAGIHWSELVRGSANGVQSTPVAFVAVDRASAARFTARLPAAGSAALGRVDFARSAVVAVFGEFGCEDHRVAVTSIVQHGSRLVVSMVLRPLALGTMECMALFETYRLLAVPKTALGRPYPTSAEAVLARA